MRCTFNLKDKNKDGATLIYLKAYFKKEGRKFVYSTGETIDPKDPFAGASEDVQTPLSQKAAMDARLDLAGGSAWARSALALRRGQEEILEHLLGQSSI